MLDITILKVEHYGVREAKKLLPYIQNCEIFCPEFSCGTEKEAQEQETLWENTLTSGISRSQFKKCFSFQNEAPKMMDYNMKLYDYCFRSKRLMWYLERFSSQEAEELTALNYESLKYYDKAQISLKEGDIEEYFEKYRDFSALNETFCSKRDQHIGTNLVIAEERIRERYPTLEDIKHLRLVIQIGALHKIEEYSKLPVKVENLLGEPRNIYDKHNLAILQEKTFDERKNYILAEGLVNLAKDGFINSSEFELEKMSFEELSQVVKCLSN